MHEDLIGYEYIAENGETVKVTGPCSWSEQYVNVTIGDTFETVKPAGVVRRRKQIEEGS